MDNWDASAAARLIEEHRVRNAQGTPFHLHGLLETAAASQRDLSSLTDYLIGGANVPPALVEQAQTAGLATYRCYGSSEHPTISSGTPSDPLDKRAGTDGRLLDGCEVRILDDEGADLPRDQEGEIVCRGPELFVGYTKDALNAESFLPGGWFRTGDVGVLDADGYLRITDRKKDIIIRGGENISSKEVEDILARHPAVVEAAVVGMPDERYGERVCAYVILHHGAKLALPEVLDHFAAEGVARQKTPEQLIEVDELPRTPMGKVRKVELRTRLRK
jgi:acyl-CoA synthetase (AMP-forming)/AMP-acid ligase II